MQTTKISKYGCGNKNHLRYFSQLITEIEQYKQTSNLRAAALDKEDK
jgi:hypothetical protein